MADITKITTHKDDAKNRLPGQFKDKSNLNSLLDSFIQQVQDIEDMFFDFLTLKDIDSSVGSQLDMIGEIVVMPRLGRTDARYRIMLRAKIGINTSESESEKVISTFKLIAGASEVTLLPIYPAGVSLFADVDFSAFDIDEIYTLMQQVVGAGVKLRVLGWYDGDDAFTFAENPNGKGFGDLLDPLVGGKYAALILP